MKLKLISAIILIDRNIELKKKATVNTKTKTNLFFIIIFLSVFFIIDFQY